MMTYEAMAMVIILSCASQTKNPVKLSVYLMLISILLFFSMASKTSQIWFPTLMFLMFTGGILMMFMILSSVLPNENPGKSWMKMILTAALLVGAAQESKMLMTSQTHPSIKSILNLSLMMIVMFSLISIYFLTVIFMASSSSSPLKLSLACQKSD